MPCNVFVWMYNMMLYCNHLKQSQAIDDIPPIMDSLFECTLEMVSKNLEDFPEHRTNFFRMLQSITQHCFPGRLTDVNTCTIHIVRY